MSQKAMGQNLKVNSSIVRNRKKKLRQKVLKMLAVMEASRTDPQNSTPGASPSTTAHVEEFLSTGRTGRRNALPDILNDHSSVTTSELPIKLEGLSTKEQAMESAQDQPSTSKASQNFR